MESADRASSASASVRGVARKRVMRASKEVFTVDHATIITKYARNELRV
jgi:hypothetical protein